MLISIKKWHPDDKLAYGSDEDEWNAVCDEMNVEQLDQADIADCNLDSDSEGLPIFPVSVLCDPGLLKNNAE